METTRQTITVLVAEDDPDDRKFIKKAFGAAKSEARFIFVEDGEELMDYLKRREIYKSEDASPIPDLIILDLYLPKRDGKSLLKEIRASARHKKTPILILTGSQSDEDLLESFNLGVNSYHQKPNTMTEWIQLAKELSSYWIV